MNLSIAIVGLPNVGKSTLFNALTNNNILAANYPFATIEPNTGIVPVPDERLNKLAEIYKSQKIIPATVEFVDVAGLVAGASKGEGLGNQFLANIRECNAIAHVVRAFADDAVVRHDNTLTNPKNDIETINTELILADLQTIDNHLPKLEREAKANPKLKDRMDNLQKLKHTLSSGQLLSSLPQSDIQPFSNLNLLTAKPIIFVFNVDEDGLSDSDYQTELQQLVAPAPALFVCAKLEDEIKSLPITEAKELLESYGVNDTGLSQLIHSAYDILGLQSFLTAGEKETRAWTIRKGWTAPQAAGVIHTDFEKGFIAAQVINYHDLIAAGSEAKAREAGKIRTEGRAYVMQADDVVEFRFNV